jgi:YesN/AraC family two-component response regulator
MEGGPQRKQNLELLKTKRVLYVEDEGGTSHQLSLFLKTKVKILYLAFDGKSGLEAYKKYKPDVVLTDVRMPGMDGFELAGKIREIDSKVPIIIITAFDKEEYISKSADMGIYQYIMKPTDPHLLLDTIVSSLQKNPAKPV